MAALRFPSRHLHKTLCDHVSTQLVALGWVNDPVNFGGDPVIVVEQAPGRAGVPITAPTVGISLGEATPVVEAEMGAGLVTSTHELFIDVYGPDWSTTTAIIDDVVAMLTDLRMPVTDYTSVPPVVSDHFLEIDEVGVTEPPASIGSGYHWLVASADVGVFYVA